ncbi:hypothetical protein C8R43DRAFT_264629 [Mycena crocata]|nr:hypothetical protein C8R43DRAFT_264629 [Mycena crocata]
MSESTPTPTPSPSPSPTTTSSALSLFTKRRRAHVACTHCRQRKIKCVTPDENAYTPCSRCTKRGFACSYVSVAAQQMQTESQLLADTVPTRRSPRTSRPRRRSASDRDDEYEYSSTLRVPELLLLRPWDASADGFPGTSPLPSPPFFKFEREVDDELSPAPKLLGLPDPREIPFERRYVPSERRYMPPPHGYSMAETLPPRRCADRQTAYVQDNYAPPYLLERPGTTFRESQHLYSGNPIEPPDPYTLLLESCYSEGSS